MTARPWRTAASSAACQWPQLFNSARSNSTVSFLSSLTSHRTHQSNSGASCVFSSCSKCAFSSPPSSPARPHEMSAEDALAGLEDLAAYEQQQAEVAAMLLEDPENEELQAIYNDLAEVGLWVWVACCISRQAYLRRRRCRRFPSPTAAAAARAYCLPVSPPLLSSLLQVIELARELQQGSAAEAAGGAAAAQADAAEQSAAADAAAHMPGAMAEHIKHAQHRSAFGGQGPAAWAVGATCRALYSGDNKW